jgi:hypothetical protein
MLLAVGLAGTSPTNAGSVFRVGQAVKSGSGFTITWPSVPGKSYQVFWADNPSGPWQGFVDSQVTAENGQTSLSYLDATATNVTKRFYRVKLVVP